MVSIPVPREPAKTASIAPITSYRSTQEAVTQQAWQRQIMDWVVGGPGVLGFAATLKSTVCALGTWWLGEPDGRGGWKRVEDPRELAVLSHYRGLGGESKDELLRKQIFQLETVAELVLGAHNTSKGTRYELLSVNQIQPEAANSELLGIRDSPEATGKRNNDQSHRDLRYLPRAQAARMWTPHPYWPEVAHSHMQRAIPSIRRLESAETRLRRLTDSRLVNNNMVWLAAEAAAEYTGAGKGKANFHEDFARYAKRQFTSRGGIEEAAPFTFSSGHTWGPPQLIDLASKIEAGDLDAETAAYRAIGRALDLPMRIFFESDEGGNHWSDWLVESQFLLTSAGPATQRALDSLTVAWLRPALEVLKALKWLPQTLDVENRRLMVDMSGALKNPDESKLLMEAWRMGIATRETVAKRGLNLSEDEILQLPDDYDDFETWATFVARSISPLSGSDAYAQGSAPEAKTASLGEILERSRQAEVPPQLLALAIQHAAESMSPEPIGRVERVFEAEEKIRESSDIGYIDHDALAADDDLLELVAA